jgi:hypothetical protein
MSKVLALNSSALGACKLRFRQRNLIVIARYARAMARAIGSRYQFCASRSPGQSFKSTGRPERRLTLQNAT